VNHSRRYTTTCVPMLSLLAVTIALSGMASAQVTQRVSISWVGHQGDGHCWAGTLSPDGRYVVFSSASTNLVPGDTNGVRDVFLRDRRAGVTERLSVDSAGAQANGDSDGAMVSADGRFVAFTSLATNLVAGDSNGTADAFVRDRVTGVTERVTIDTNGIEGNAGGAATSVSADGRFTVFTSESSNLVPIDTNNASDVFLRDRQTGTTEMISRTVTAQGDGPSYGGCISADGRFVAFCSSAHNLVSADTNGVPDVFVCDRTLPGVVIRVDVDSSGVQLTLPPSSDDSISAWISPDGQYIGFYSLASNLVAGDTNGAFDIFLHHLASGLTERVSLDGNGLQGNGDSIGTGSISYGGRYVVFYSVATNLVSGDTNQKGDVFLRDRQVGTTQRLSVDSGGEQSNGYEVSDNVTTTWDGSMTMFDSLATNLVPQDTNGHGDVFVRIREGLPDATSVCQPGTSGVIACPCANAPAGLDRGCDNSALTGGAVLAALGGTYVSSDSLVFVTSSQTPLGLSILTQWTATYGPGVVFGMGVRCTSGAFKRLYVKQSAAGSITAPQFGAGDLPVTVRSAMLGDIIHPGQNRWYFVYYRDPIVLGGCPPGSTFNCTQTDQVTWSF